MGPIAAERDPRITVDAMLQAVNEHQLEKLAASFDADYVNETPRIRRGASEETPR